MIQRGISGGGAEATVWDTQTGSCVYSDLLPGLGNVLLVRGDQVYPLVKRSGSRLHFICIERRSRITVDGDTMDQAYSDEPGGHFAFVHHGSELTLFSTASVLEELAKMPPGEVRVMPAAEANTRPLGPQQNTGEVVFLSTHDMVAIVRIYEIHLYRVSDGAHLHTLPTRLGLATAPVFAPDGEHLVCHFDGEIQVWNIAREKVVARIMLLRDGALAVEGGQFQRLPSAHPDSPSLEGFYARAGARLTHLDRLTHLESKTFCASIWRTLWGPIQDAR